MAGKKMEHKSFMDLFSDPAALEDFVQSQCESGDREAKPKVKEEDTFDRIFHMSSKRKCSSPFVDCEPTRNPAVKNEKKIPEEHYLGADTGPVYHHLAAAHQQSFQQNMHHPSMNMPSLPRQPPCSNKPQHRQPPFQKQQQQQQQTNFAHHHHHQQQQHQQQQHHQEPHRQQTSSSCPSMQPQNTFFMQQNLNINGSPQQHQHGYKGPASNATPHMGNLNAAEIEAGKVDATCSGRNGSATRLLSQMIGSQTNINVIVNQTIYDKHQDMLVPGMDGVPTAMSNLLNSQMNVHPDLNVQNTKSPPPTATPRGCKSRAKSQPKAKNNATGASQATTKAATKRRSKTVAANTQQRHIEGPQQAKSTAGNNDKMFNSNCHVNVVDFLESRPHGVMVPHMHLNHQQFDNINQMQQKLHPQHYLPGLVQQRNHQPMTHQFLAMGQQQRLSNDVVPCVQRSGVAFAQQIQEGPNHLTQAMVVHNQGCHPRMQIANLTHIPRSFGSASLHAPTMRQEAFMPSLGNLSTSTDTINKSTAANLNNRSGPPEAKRYKANSKGSTASGGKASQQKSNPATVAKAERKQPEIRVQLDNHSHEQADFRGPYHMTHDQLLGINSVNESPNSYLTSQPSVARSHDAGSIPYSMMLAAGNPQQCFRPTQQLMHQNVMSQVRPGTRLPSHHLISATSAASANARFLRPNVASSQLQSNMHPIGVNCMVSKDNYDTRAPGIMSQSTINQQRQHQLSAMYSNPVSSNRNMIRDLDVTAQWRDGMLNNGGNITNAGMMISGNQIPASDIWSSRIVQQNRVPSAEMQQPMTTHVKNAITQNCLQTLASEPVERQLLVISNAIEAISQNPELSNDEPQVLKDLTVRKEQLLYQIMNQRNSDGNKISASRSIQSSQPCLNDQNRFIMASQLQQQQQQSQYRRTQTMQNVAHSHSTDGFDDKSFPTTPSSQHQMLNRMVTGGVPGIRHSQHLQTMSMPDVLSTFRSSQGGLTFNHPTDQRFRFPNPAKFQDQKCLDNVDASVDGRADPMLRLQAGFTSATSRNCSMGCVATPVVLTSGREADVVAVGLEKSQGKNARAKTSEAKPKKPAPKRVRKPAAKKKKDDSSMSATAIKPGKGSKRTTQGKSESKAADNNGVSDKNKGATNAEKFKLATSQSASFPETPLVSTKSEVRSNTMPYENCMKASSMMDDRWAFNDTDTKQFVGMPMVRTVSSNFGQDEHRVTSSNRSYGISAPTALPDSWNFPNVDSSISVKVDTPPLSRTNLHETTLKSNDTHTLSHVPSLCNSNPSAMASVHTDSKSPCGNMNVQTQQNQRLAIDNNNEVEHIIADSIAPKISHNQRVSTSNESREGLKTPERKQEEIPFPQQWLPQGQVNNLDSMLEFRRFNSEMQHTLTEVECLKNADISKGRHVAPEVPPQLMSFEQKIHDMELVEQLNAILAVCTPKRAQPAVKEATMEKTDLEVLESPTANTDCEDERLTKLVIPKENTVPDFETPFKDCDDAIKRLQALIDLSEESKTAMEKNDMKVANNRHMKWNSDITAKVEQMRIKCQHAITKADKLASYPLNPPLDNLLVSKLLHDTEKDNVGVAKTLHAQDTEDPETGRLRTLKLRCKSPRLAPCCRFHVDAIPRPKSQACKVIGGIFGIPDYKNIVESEKASQQEKKQVQK